MDDPLQQRHKPPTPLERPRELVVACPPLRSNINLSRIARAAGCCGVERILCCGPARLLAEVARDAGEAVRLENHRTLAPLLPKLRHEGFRLVGLEQTSNSHSLYTFRFPRRTLLVVGNERGGIDEEILRQLDDVVEIPVYGRPFAHNVATATAIAMYEYCRQHPHG